MRGASALPRRKEGAGRPTGSARRSKCFQGPEPDVTPGVEDIDLPGPDPSGVTISELPNGGWSVMIETFMLSGRTQRQARARRVLVNLKRDGWACRWCGDPVPEWRRSDAAYCCAGCKGRALRARRAATLHAERARGVEPNEGSSRDQYARAREAEADRLLSPWSCRTTFRIRW